MKAVKYRVIYQW